MKVISVLIILLQICIYGDYNIYYCDNDYKQYDVNTLANDNLIDVYNYSDIIKTMKLTEYKTLKITTKEHEQSRNKTSMQTMIKIDSQIKAHLEVNYGMYIYLIFDSESYLVSAIKLKKEKQQ